MIVARSLVSLVDDDESVRESLPELELKLRRQEIPIVFITAQRDETLRARMLEQGAVECLFKPFSDTALLEALNAALRVS